MGNLFRQGPHEDALNYAHSLYAIRLKWVVWLTPEIEAGLEKFEAAIRTIGTNAHLLNAMPGTQEAIDRMLRICKRLRSKVWLRAVAREAGFEGIRDRDSHYSSSEPPGNG